MDTTLKCVVFLLVFFTQEYVTRAGRACTFPRIWQGRWYRNALGNMGEVNIKDSSIEGIGDCVGKKSGDRFLIHDRDESCHKCIIAIERDNNVIQYKKGDCVKEENEPPNFTYICKQIRVESPMITLVRAGASPIECPLGRVRHISYDNNTGVYCNSPKSQLQTCASTGKMRLQFGACDDVALTHDKEFVAECLAEWKDGSDRYIYTSITDATTQQALVFRCFQYELHGPEILVRMSTDASCRPHMKMRLHEEATPDASCLFPTWIQHARWMDFSGKAIYNVQSDGQELYANRLKDSEDTGRTTHRFSCLNRVDGNQSEVYMSVRSIHKCSSSFQCLKLQKNTDGIIQITESSKSKTAPDNCLSHLSQKKHVHSVAILVRDTQEEDCPITGAFKAGECSKSAGYFPMTSLEIGCIESSIFSVFSKKEDERIIDSYRCLKEWRHDGMQFIIARDKKTSAFACLVHGNINGHESLIRSDNCQITNGQVCTVAESRDFCLGRSHPNKVSNRGGGGGPDYQGTQTGHTDTEHASETDHSTAAVIMYSSITQYVLQGFVVTQLVAILGVY